MTATSPYLTLPKRSESEVRMTRKPHPAEGRPNRYPARCSKCSNMVKAGEGLTEKIMGTTNGWRTYHVDGGCASFETYAETVHPHSSEAFEK